MEREFLEQLAAGTAAPGGGAAGAYAGAMAAALVAMVARLTARDPQHNEIERLQQTISQADELRGQLVQSAGEDSAAFSAYLAARQVDDEAQQQAARQVIDVPLTTAAMAQQVSLLAAWLCEAGQGSARPDACVAADLARVCLETALMNARANLALLADGGERHAYLLRIEALQAEAV